MAAMGGPQSLLGWWVGALIVLCDGQVWSELGAPSPARGQLPLPARGVRPAKWGRLMAFLFIWSFVLSGPLEIASGSSASASTHVPLAGYSPEEAPILGAGGGPAGRVLLARRITFLSRIT
jgi:hypothetical protein